MGFGPDLYKYVRGHVDADMMQGKRGREKKEKTDIATIQRKA